MTVLSDRVIIQKILWKRLVIEPLLYPIQPASVDLRLGHVILEAGGIYDPDHGIFPEEKSSTLYAELVLLPGRFVNVSTLEHIEIPNGLVGIIGGKSRHARFGLQVESAGYVDPGWKGNLTLELKNLGECAIILHPGITRIAQIRFEETTGMSDNLYGDIDRLDSHFQGATGPEMRFPEKAIRLARSQQARREPDPVAE